ncbi:MAG: protein kinase [Symploca sp. SIO1B1]|nr:protein kinase [Symploca sp. SIO1B1]
MNQKYSFICINPSCTAQPPEVSFQESSVTHCECGWNLGWKSHKGELYFLKHFRGKGGYGSVYEAWKRTQNGFEDKYVVKFLHRRSGASIKECKKELIREVQALQKAYEVGARVPQYCDCYFPTTEKEQEQYNNFFLVQEFIEGKNLLSILQYRRAQITEGRHYFEEKELFQYLIDLLETLHLLKEQNILHRDIKPHNIIQRSIVSNAHNHPGENENLYLVDFGSSKQLEPGIENEYYTKNYPRTPLYAPPEILRGTDLERLRLYWDKYQWLIGDFNSDLSLHNHRWTRDIYSLGITIFDLLTGIPITISSRYQPSDKEWSNWMSILREKIPNLYPILEKMTRFYPDERYQTAMDALLDASAQAWDVYGDREDKSWLLKEKLLNDLLDYKTQQETKVLPQQQQRFLKESQEEIKRQKEIRRQKIENFRKYIINSRLSDEFAEISFDFYEKWKTLDQKDFDGKLIIEWVENWIYLEDDNFIAEKIFNIFVEHHQEFVMFNDKTREKIKKTITRYLMQEEDFLQRLSKLENYLINNNKCSPNRLLKVLQKVFNYEKIDKKQYELEIRELERIRLIEWNISEQVVHLIYKDIIKLNEISLRMETTSNKIENEISQIIETVPNQIKSLSEAELQALLAEKDSRISSLENMIQTVLQRPSLYAQTYTHQGDTMSQAPKKYTKNELPGATFGGGWVDSDTVNSNQIGAGAFYAHQIGGNINNYPSEQRQSLADAAEEIQKLLQQLEQSYPNAGKLEKQSTLTFTLQQEIKQNPTFRKRLKKALKEGGLEALKVLFAPIGIPIEMIRGWIEAEAE